jgi:hypothetical protein
MGKEIFLSQILCKPGLPAAHIPFLAIRFRGTEAWDFNLERAEEVPD